MWGQGVSIPKGKSYDDFFISLIIWNKTPKRWGKEVEFQVGGPGWEKLFPIKLNI
jgi:hypothetical protein